MKKIIFILVFLLIINFVSAQNVTEMNFNEINVDVHIGSSAKVQPTSSNWDVDYIFANLTFFPRDDEWQDILSKNFIYGSSLEEKNDYIYFKWDDLSETELEYGLDFNVKNKFRFEHVKNKINFPINEEDIPEEIRAYLEPTDTINSDDSKIIEQATAIAEGKDDLYQVVFDIGIWVNDNINYDLNTLTENAQQNARWVLDNKEGVCDEITVLFIAMLRSIGIPAKFTSGSSYSNLINGFGNHAWAEVYFPGEGWVSFDVTYGQFGYADASHIKFKESIEAKDSSVNYGWRSNNVEVEFEPLDIDTELIYNGGELEKKVELDVNLLENNVGDGSYIPVEIKVKNLKNYYVPMTLFLTKAAVDVEDNIKNVLLKPNEEKSVFWIIEVPKNIESGYIYTSNIEFADYFGSSDNKDLKYAKNYEYYSLEEAEEKIENLEEESESSYNGDLDFKCKLPKNVFYTYEKGNMTCTLKNKGNLNFDDLKVCFLNDCKTFDLLINQEHKVYFEFDTNLENKEYSVSAESNDLIKYYYFDMRIFESPNLNIKNLSYNNEIGFKDLGELKFNLLSDSPCYDIIIKLGKKDIFNIQRFEGHDSFLVPFEGGFFYNKNQKISIEYKDNNGKEYIIEQDLNINVINAPFYIKIFDFLGLI